MKRILLLLKPLVASLGFNEKELEGVAKSIFDSNLELQKEDASDEEINAKINAVIPILKVAQQNSTRIINDKKKNEQPTEETPESGSEKSKTLTQEIADAMKLAIEPLTKEIAMLKADKATSSRKARLEEALKDSGNFGKKVLKDFEERIYKTIENEEDFESYLESTKVDVLDHVQDEKNRGLSSFTMAGGSSTNISKSEPKAEDLDSIIENY